MKEKKGKNAKKSKEVEAQASTVEEYTVEVRPDRFGRHATLDIVKSALLIIITKRYYYYYNLGLF